jgi:hypothetical protein
LRNERFHPYIERDPFISTKAEIETMVEKLRVVIRAVE